MTIKTVHVVGGGLAGSEAAWQLAQKGVPVTLHEMRPLRATAAHKTDGYAELVCSNSFRSDDKDHNAVGLLHAEMRRLGSLVMQAADANQVPAGGALAVDRDGFSAAVTAALVAHPLVTLVRGEVSLRPRTGTTSLSRPVPSPHPIWRRPSPRSAASSSSPFSMPSRRSYIASPSISTKPGSSRATTSPAPAAPAPTTSIALTREQYDAFVDALIVGDKTSFHDWEASTPYFDGCLPIEVMAERGRETLRHGPMKPFGLTNPHAPGVKPYAVVQLRQDNKLGTLFNMVGFQTKLKHGEQVRIFRNIPGLQNAEFARLGGLHRNTFLNSPKLLDDTLRLKANLRWRFAGQITGCEGYVESAAIGLLAARFAAAERQGEPMLPPPPTTAHGALLAHITGGHIETIDAGPSSFQPMNVNFGLFPPLGETPASTVTAANSAAARPRTWPAKRR